MDEKCLKKDRKLFVTFIDLEKAYDGIDRKIFRNVLRIYYMESHLLVMIMFFYEGVNAAAHVNGNRSESYCVNVSVRQLCGVTIAV